MTRRGSFALAALAVAGCSPQPVTPGPAEQVTQDSATAKAPQRASPAPTGYGIPEFGIPVKIQGRWALVPDDCTSTRGDAKGLLNVSATSLGFYESRGTLSKIAERSDTRLRATFAFSGEGMTWNRDVVLDVQDGGKSLIRREYGEDADPGPFKYMRCPA